MARAEPVARPASEVLERERRLGPRAGVLALVAGVLVVVGNVLLQVIYRDVPRVPLVDAIRDAAGENLGRPGLMTEKILFYDDQAVPLVVTSIVQAIGVLCAALVLVYLHDGTQDRGGRIPRIARLVALVGGVATAVGFVALQVIAAVLSHDFATGDDQSTQAAHDALRSGVLVAAQFVGTIGTLAMTLAFVIIPLNAMRVGLLTRFLGILGIIVGLLQIIPLGPSAFIVQAFWLLAVGALLLRLWPRGVPPAWTTGEAVPWPTQQELREQRERARGGAAPAPAGPVAPATGAPSPSAAKRKRKRRDTPS